jgi:hypothetical protein
MCIQYFPYRSATKNVPNCVLPSQRFSWTLARQAIAEEKLIVVLRSWEEWAAAVPELRHYPCVRLNQVRSPFVSEGNMASNDWSRMLRALSD